MRLRLIAGVISVFVVVALALGIVLLGPSLLLGANDATVSPTTVTQGATATDNVIVRENAQLGTSSWRIPAGHVASTQIQAYAGSTYVLPGKSITLYVSTQKAGVHYRIDVYRLGWYQGLGGRLMFSSSEQVGHAQGYYNLAAHRLLDCASCLVDKQTGMVEANWQPSYTLQIPSDWTTGVYLVKFTDASGWQTYAPFDVLGNFNSTYVAVTPDTTYAAYNDWGGSSLYDRDGVSTVTELGNEPKGVKVSFDRPYDQEAGSSQVLVYEVDAIRWMERQGYDLSYISNVYLQNDPGQLLHHKAYLSLGHDEYWTKEMRDAVEQARDKGVGLAFLGADAAYWQMRFEPDSAGVPDRTIVCYKVLTTDHDLADDPLFGQDNTRLTTLWRDPALGRPENELVGVMFSDLTHKQQGFPWRVSPDANSPLLKGTGLQPGQAYGCGLVGYEWDRVFANDGVTPAGLQVLGASPTVNDSGHPDSSNTTYYIAPSGAMVFATGSIYWTYGLDSYRLHADPTCGSRDTVIPGMQTLMANVMAALIVRHAPNGQ